MTSPTGPAATEAGNSTGAVAIAAPPRSPTRPGTLRTFESLSNRSFRWFIYSTVGQFAALQSQQFVTSFIAYELTNSYARLGLLSLISSIPALALSLHGGVLADRLPKRRVLQAGQAASFGIALALTVLLFLDLVRFEHLLVAAVLQGAVMALMMPSRQSIIADIVPHEQLTNAVSLNTTGMTSTRTLAPAIAGVILAFAGWGWGYLLVVGGWLLAFGTMVPVTAPAPQQPLGRRRDLLSSGFRDGWAGLQYVRTNRPVQLVLLLNLAIVAATMPYLMLLSGFVKSVLHLGPIWLGVFGALTGVGSVLGSLVIASMPVRNRGRRLLFSALLLGVAVMAFAVSRDRWLTAVIVTALGVGHAGRMSLTAALLQSYSAPAFRGRVMALYMVEFALVSLGVFAVGVLSSFIGISWAIGGTAAALVLLAAAAYRWSPTLRDLQ